MTIEALTNNEYDPYYGRYINKLSKSIGLRESFESGKNQVITFFGNIPSSKMDYTYAEGKWTCKEILQHLVDTERIFQYRCFRIARNDKTELAGFDQNIYVEPSLAKHKTMERLLGEFEMVRNSTLSLLHSLTDDDLKRIGIANGGNMSARAAAFTITGHEIWHMEIIQDKYL